ncbi:hypothetical protein BH18VER1_BH18VER1_05560 [soil metagenome]
MCFLQKTWLRCAFLALIGFAVRSPALSGQLIWDDQFLAHDNPFIKSPWLILETFRHHLFLDSFSGHYRPVQNISYIVDYFFWNTDTYGFHLTNVLLHVASGLSLYFLLCKLLPSLRYARAGSGEGAGVDPLGLTSFLVALLWMVHPVHSAAIDYISGRADSLAFLFASGAWLLVIAAREQRRFARALLSACAALAGLMALCSREIAGIWFAIFLLHLFVFEKKIDARFKTIALIGSLALLATYAGLRQLPERRSERVVASAWTEPFRSVLMLRALGDYGRLMIFPSNLHMERNVLDGRNYESVRQWRESAGTEYLSIAGLALFAGLVAGCLRGGASRRLRIFGSLWFFLGYLPISNLFDLNATVAEHWLYLPSVGFLIFLAGCALDLPPGWQKGTAAFACLAMMTLSARSAMRSTDWANAETFYTRTVAAGGSSVRVCVNLGLIYARRGENERAEKIFRRALQIEPDDPIARNNLADVLSRQGKREEAERMFAASNDASVETRKEHPRSWIAAVNVARLRFARGDKAGALAVLEKAHRDYPGIWDIIKIEAEIARQERGPDAALELVENFAGANWWHYGASLALGRLWAQKGEVEKAAAAFRQASRLDIHDAEALNLIAGMRMRQNRLEEACASQRRAVARQPEQPRQYLMLSDILHRMGRNDEARALVAQVTRMQALVETAAN